MRASGAKAGGKGAKATSAAKPSTVAAAKPGKGKAAAPAEEVEAEAVASDTPAPGAMKPAGGKGAGGKKGAAAAASAAGPHFTEEERTEFRSKLLDWYDRTHRVLPWRRTPHSKKEAAAGGAEGGEDAVGPAPASLPDQQFAYWVWVSEVMLQQTQVATVIPFFKRWVAKWPTVADLAAADVDSVNAMWAGLGYYRRARYLLDGAQFVVQKLGGAFPTTAAELLKIPGVGPYTSAAVASIAFGSPAAAVDGNVIRVVSRLRSVAGDPTKLTHLHNALAAELLDSERPGCYNQALMELGATVCRPGAGGPDCGACPVRGVCRAAAEWEAYLAAGGAPDVEDAPRVTNYPGKKAVKGKREQAVAVTVLEVICAKQQQQQPDSKQPQGKQEREQDKAGEKQQAAVAAEPAPRKRQKTMADFALAAAARKQAAAAAGDGGGAGGAGGGGGADLEALVARGVRHYLLVMRPEGGLLAGLWEFPGAIMSDVVPEGEGAAAAAAPTAAERQRAAESLLTRLLGPCAEGLAAPSGSSAAAGAGQKRAAEAADGAAATAAAGGSLRVLGRHDMGQYVHVFSHIRQTNYVQRLTVVYDGDVASLLQLTGASEVTAVTVAPAAQEDEAKKGGKGEAKEGEGAKRFSGRKAAAKKEKEEEDEEAEEADEEEAEADGEAEEQEEGEGAGGSKAGSKPGRSTGKGKAAAGAGGEAGAKPALAWATRQQIEGPGLPLSSGVKRILELAVGGSAGAGAGGAGKAGGGKAAGKAGGAGKAGAAKGKGGKAGGK